MESQIPHETLMRYLDGELPPAERERVAQLLEGSTELQREVAIFRAMQRDLADLSFDPPRADDSVWSSVNRRIARPIGWLLVIVGVVVWGLYSAWVFVTTPGEPYRKLTAGAIVIGAVILFAGVGWEQFRAWRTDPYRDVHR